MINKLHKNYYFLFLILIPLLAGFEEDSNHFYKTAQFKTGFPEYLNKLKKDLPFEIVSHTELQSGNDSVQVYFGELRQGEEAGNWVALSINDQLQQLSTLSYNYNAESEKENTFDVKFNNSKNRLSFRIKELDTIKNTVIYTWVNELGLSDSLNVSTIDNPLQVGKDFADIKLKRLNGEAFKLSEYKNKVVVINWWATWCSPCRKEIPGLNKLVEKYSRDNIKFIAITDDSKERVKNYLNSNEFNYEITFIASDSRPLFGNSYPTNIIIDTTGTISYYSEGAGDNTPAIIDSHLAQQVER